MNNSLSKWSNKVILLTGCNGFIGKALLIELISIFSRLEESGLTVTHHIYAIDNGITSRRWSMPLRNYITYYDDNAITFDYAALKRVDIVFHLAGLASPAQYKRYPLETIDVSVLLTRSLLEASLHWKATFIFFSSSEIYGNPSSDYIPTPESYKGYVSCQGPRSCYDESKRMAETLCYVYKNYFNVDTRVIRPFNIYGPGMGKYDYRMIPNMMRSIIQGETIKIYGSGTQTRTFCFISDAIECILQVATGGSPGETYNVGNDSPELSMIELADIAKEILPAQFHYEVVDYPDSYPADEPLRRCPDITKVKEELGYLPKVSIHSGLRQTYDWCNSVYKSDN